MKTMTTLAPRHTPPGAGRVVRVIGDLVTFKAVAADTRGAYSLFETLTAPGGGTPPHYQRFEEETFFVLEGVYEFRVGDEITRLEAGGYAFVPRGVIHAFTNVGEAPARMLILVTPGGIHEQFFAEVGTPADLPPAGPPDLDHLLTTAARHGIEILPPPGA